jgi:hypothetical protein
MGTMTDVTAKHASRASADKSSAKAAAWSVLITMGTTSVIMNVYDAIHAGHLILLIAVLKGLAPVYAAMGLSEVGARFDGGRVFKAIAFSVMGGAMVLSSGAIASVLHPAEPKGVIGVILAWMFGAVIDAAAMTCVWVLLTDRERRRKAANEEQAVSVEQEVAAAVAATEARITAAAGQEAISMHERIAELETQLRAAHERSQERSRSGAPKPRRSAPVNGDTQDLTAELRALQMLDAHPELRAKGMAGELGRRLGLSGSYARKLHARLTAEERPEERPEERAPGALQERTAERPRETQDKRSPEGAQERP